MQLMAVCVGGALEQHVPDVVGHEGHSPGGFVRLDLGPEVAGSLVLRLVGDDMQVSCHHHQAVGPHPGFDATGRAADGTIEAIEDPSRPFRLGVQWHPETADDHGLFPGLVEAASRRGGSGVTG